MFKHSKKVCFIVLTLYAGLKSPIDSNWIADCSAAYAEFKNLPDDERVERRKEIEDWWAEEPKGRGVTVRKTAVLNRAWNAMQKQVRRHVFFPSFVII